MQKKTNNKVTNSNANVEPSNIDALCSSHKLQAFNTKVSIHVHSRRKRLCDPDNVCAKWVIDGLRYAKVLKDDTPQYVKEVTYSQEKGEPEETVITIVQED